DPATTQFLTGDQGRDRETVQVLLDAIKRVSDMRTSETQDIGALLDDIVDRSVEITGAERGLLLLETPEGELTVRTARERGGPVTEEPRFSTTIAKRVLEEGVPIRATVQSDSQALEIAQSVFDLKLRAVMCVPISAERSDGAGRRGPRDRGVLYVDSRAATRQFHQHDLSLFAALAQHIAIALENARLHLDSLEKVRLEQSLELASAIQRDLMPAVPSTLPGFDVHGWYRPAERAAGDFYDFVRAKAGRLGVVVGDVTGHGIGPALITASAQAGLKSYLRLVEDPGEALTLLNQDLSERVEDGRFLTLFLALIAPDGELRALNAGHPSAILFRRAEGDATLLPQHGCAIGMLDDEVYRTGETLRMEPGDALLAYTDGLIEVPSPAGDGLLGERGLAELFAATQRDGLSARATAVRLAE
ncbi:MAG TPA: SpoIIE family protein phosphatase, partial [Planctomycetota bacterium]|nr:SpoIIE family protein phosphatase [Planctomycetota bacterium]